MSKRILFIVGDYSEDYEVMVPFQALSAVGHEVFAVCPDKKEGDSIRTAVHESEGEQTYSEKPGHKFRLNASFDEVEVSSFDALVVPGGRAPEYLRINDKVIDMVRHFAKENKPIASICHGPQVLAAADVLEGKSCTANAVCEPEVRKAGGVYKNIEVTKAMVDGNLVTAKAWPAHPEWIAKFLEVLGTKISH
jgi:protease I